MIKKLSVLMGIVVLGVSFVGCGSTYDNSELCGTPDSDEDYGRGFSGKRSDVDAKPNIYIYSDETETETSLNDECTETVSVEGDSDINKNTEPTWNTDPNRIIYEKPNVYVYPDETETVPSDKGKDVTVSLSHPEKITCSYPEYKYGWNVKAFSDGTLIDKDTGKMLYSLYYEAVDGFDDSFSEGFCVAGDDIVDFLEEKLDILGLNYKEKEEFIIYWLPRLQSNKYNLIRFLSMDELNAHEELIVNPEPETLIRINMIWKGVDEYVDIKEQKLETANRTGYTVVEWGGIEVE